MLFLLSLAGASALAVIAYNQLKLRNPDLDGSALVTTQQLAAVIAVLTTAVEGVLRALRDPRPVAARPVVRSWEAWDLDGEDA